MGVQDPECDPRMQQLGGYIRLYRLLGCRTQEPAGCNRRDRFESEFIAPTTQFGIHGQKPTLAIAYKFQAERAVTRLNSVSFQVGRTGAVTPVANLEPVLLAGTTVKRASLHNADIIEGLDLHLGDKVFVEKGGEIIPKIVGVDVEARGLLVGDKVRFIRSWSRMRDTVDAS